MQGKGRRPIICAGRRQSFGPAPGLLTDTFLDFHFHSKGVGREHGGKSAIDF